MPPSDPLVRNIQDAHRKVWPDVSAAYSKTHQSMLELAGVAEEVTPRVEEYVTKGPSATLRRRKVCEETIWVLAQMGLLRSGGERDVIQAAKAWADVTDNDASDDDQIIEAEDRLIQALGTLPEYDPTRATLEV